MRGFWSATILRTLIETYIPSLLFIVFLYLWQPNHLIELSWLYIFSLFPDLWGWVWPAFRLKPMSKGKRLRGWISFLIPYLFLYLTYSWWSDSILQNLPIMQEIPQPPGSLQEEILIWGIVLALTLSLFSIFRLLFIGLNRFCCWASKRIVRQLTLSHMIMFVFFAWTSLSVLFLYHLIISFPQFIRGEVETEQAAEWAEPFLSSPEMKDHVNDWIKQVDKKKWDSGYYEIPGYRVKRVWRIYSEQGQYIAGTNGMKADIEQEEQMLVQQVLKGKSVKSLVQMKGSKYITAIHVHDSRGKVVGAIVQEREIEANYILDFVSIAGVLFLLLATPALLIISIIVFGFALFFAYIRVKPINNRIQRVADAARVWSSGNLLMQIQDKQKDELGVLSDQLNQVATSLRVTTEKLEKEKQQVERLLKAKREWVANVSHELRTPIAILRGHLDLWDVSGESEEKRKRVHLLQQELGRLQMMIDELFKVATIDDQDPLEGMIQLTPTSVNQLLKGIYESFSTIAWNEKKISLSLEESPQNPTILIDPIRSNQIISNLIRNAIQHTPEGGLIRIASTVEEQICMIEVMDTGIGISPEELPHIFERYYQGNVVKGIYKGAGIGLYLSKTWVEYMGGQIQVESIEGEGTKISILFPVIASEKLLSTLS